MTTLADTHPTLLDLKNRTDPDGSIARIIELLNQNNEILTDLVYQPANQPLGHVTTVRTGLPAPTWRKLYGGVQPGKSKTAQVTDTIGMLEAYAEVDCKLADINGNTEAFRISEDAAHIEGIGIEHAQTVIYGNEGSAPEEFTGLAPRFNSLSAENADNIIDAGGSGSDNTSIYVAVWGPSTGFAIHGKGFPQGVKMTDKGQVTVENVDGAGGRMEAYRTHYELNTGLVIRDWRYFGRICNIDVSDLDTLANTKNLITWMIQLSERVKNVSSGRAAFYVNRRIREKLRLGILEKIANNLTWETVTGKRVMTFDDIPVRRVDQILNTETRVV